MEHFNISLNYLEWILYRATPTGTYSSSLKSTFKIYWEELYDYHLFLEQRNIFPNFFLYHLVSLLV